LALALLDKPFERPDNYAAMCRLPARPQP
jgi:hypothetical protein